MPDRSAGPSDELLPLTRAVLSGNPVATGTFLANVLPAMLKVVRRVLGNQHPDVEDVLQEAAVGLLRALPSFRQGCTVLHFACRIAVLTSLAARRRKRFEASLYGAVDQEAAHSVGPAQALASSRRRALLRELLDSLSYVQAEALVLHCVLGHSINEIARMTEVPANTARSRVRLAKEALRTRVLGDPLFGELLGEDGDA
ncbi:MAG: sigma-70 family RNA polymerase sigma factor [Polyangiaceae bacterium]|nr:sigma-70 family RNA polymerase sigma factor [Polyangiaceae bacterium]